MHLFANDTAPKLTDLDANFGACVNVMAALSVAAGGSLALAAPTNPGRQIVYVGTGATVELPTSSLVTDVTEFLFINGDGGAQGAPITINGNGNQIATSTGLQSATGIFQNYGRLSVLWHGTFWSSGQ